MSILLFELITRTLTENDVVLCIFHQLPDLEVNGISEVSCVKKIDVLVVLVHTKSAICTYDPEILGQFRPEVLVTGQAETYITQFLETS